MKTIFIVVTRGFIVRNVLRSGCLDYLKNSGNKIIIFLLSMKGQAIPQYLKDEFASDQVILLPIEEPPAIGLYSKIYRLFCKLSSLLVYTRSTWNYSRIGNLNNLNRSIIWAYFERIIFPILGRSVLLKKLVRWIDMVFFSRDARTYAQFFKTYCPDLVFSTSIISKVDIAFMKEARRRGIKTISMTKGWDHMAKLLLRFVPDKLIVQNDNLKEIATRHQTIPAEQVIVCGFPNFDWYRRPEILMSRDDFFALLGLDPKRRLIFFGSEGYWAPQDDKIVDNLIKFIEEDKLVYKACILVRPHFTDLKKSRFDRFKGVPNVRVDDNITRSAFFNDTWDPNVSETKIFVNSLYHSDIMITVASTLALDACCLDKPIILAAFNALFSPRTGNDISQILYETNHYQEVIKTGGADLVCSETELLSSINKYLLEPDFKKSKRQALLEKLCYRVDGKSSYRMFEVLNSVLEN